MLSCDFFSEEDGECWNGEDVSPYIHPTPQFTLEDQKCNPEVVPVQLSCDTMSMTCSAYDFFSTSPPPQGEDIQYVSYSVCDICFYDI